MKFVWFFIAALVLVAADDDDDETSSNSYHRCATDFEGRKTSGESHHESYSFDHEEEDAADNNDYETNNEVDTPSIIREANIETTNIFTDTGSSSTGSGVQGRTRTTPGEKKTSSARFFRGSGGFGSGFGGNNNALGQGFGSGFGVNNNALGQGFGSGFGFNNALGGGFGGSHGIHGAQGYGPSSGIGGIVPGLANAVSGLGGGFAGVGSTLGDGYGTQSHSNTCRYWCRAPQNQAYCCEGSNEPQSFVGIVKPGQCPPVRPVCPPTRSFAPPASCSNDGACGGIDKCCFDTCLQQHLCKPPIGIGR